MLIFENKTTTVIGREDLAGILWNNCHSAFDIYLTIKVYVSNVYARVMWPVIKIHIIKDDPVMEGLVETLQAINMAQEQRVFEVRVSKIGFTDTRVSPQYVGLGPVCDWVPLEFVKLESGRQSLSPHERQPVVNSRTKENRCCCIILSKPHFAFAFDLKRMNSIS